MKTAQEWRSVWQGDCCPLPDLDQIQSIQQDAYKSGLLRAAQVCRGREELNKRENGVLSFHRFEAMRCAEAIEAEAKGKP